MNRHWKFALIGVLVAVWSGTASAQTDLAASLYGAFSGTSNGNGTTQSPANSAGALVELRHITNPLVGYEATYSFNRANQTYTGSSASPPSQGVMANAHEITADWIVSLKVLGFRPFVLAGGGVLLDIPASGQAGTETKNSGVIVYGAGVDWTILPHLGVRGQYRGNVYKAPNLATAFSSTNAFIHTAEPMIGIFLRL